MLIISEINASIDKDTGNKDMALAKLSGLNGNKYHFVHYFSILHTYAN